MSNYWIINIMLGFALAGAITVLSAPFAIGLWVLTHAAIRKVRHWRHVRRMSQLLRDSASRPYWL